MKFFIRLFYFRPGDLKISALDSFRTDKIENAESIHNNRIVSHYLCSPTFIS